MTRLCHLASNPCTPTELNNVLRVPWWPPSIRPVVHEKTRESFFSFSLLPFDDIFFFRPFCSNRLIASTRVRGDVSLSKSGEGNADDEWRSEEEMKVACRGYIFFPALHGWWFAFTPWRARALHATFFKVAAAGGKRRGQTAPFSISPLFFSVERDKIRGWNGGGDGNDGRLSGMEWKGSREILISKE